MPRLFGKPAKCVDLGGATLGACCADPTRRTESDTFWSRDVFTPSRKLLPLRCRRHRNSMLFPWLRPSLLQSFPPHLSCLFRRKFPLGPFLYHDPGSFLLDLLIRDFLIAMGASHSGQPGPLVSGASMFASHHLHSLRMSRIFELPGEQVDLAALAHLFHTEHPLDNSKVAKTGDTFSALTTPNLARLILISLKPRIVSTSNV